MLPFSTYIWKPKGFINYFIYCKSLVFFTSTRKDVKEHFNQYFEMEDK